MFIYLFLDRGEGKEKEGEKRQCVVASHTPPLGIWPATHIRALTGNRTSDPFFAGWHSLNPLSHTSQGSPNYLIIEGNKEKFPATQVLKGTLHSILLTILQII